jgi:integrase
VTTSEDGVDRIRLETATYYARFRDESDEVVERPTGCRDKSAAQAVLNEMLGRVEKIRAGVMTSAEMKLAERLKTTIADHVAAYVVHLQAEGVSPKHRAETERRLKRILADCGFRTLADLDKEPVEEWMVCQANTKPKSMSARTRNTYLSSLNAFGNWCAGKNVGRLLENPFDGIAMADEKADCRRRRRSLTEDELIRLLDVARRRPLVDALTIRHGKRKGQLLANVRPEIREQLEALGRERALTLKTLVLTGLRRNELATLTVGQLYLDDRIPGAKLDAADEKSGEGSYIVLRADLVADLRAWLGEKLSRLQADARSRDEPVPSRLPADSPVFTVPVELVKILNRDLAMAGIPKTDDRGWTIDVHAIRHTFGTLLSKGGVAPRTAQSAMRHTDIDLTMRTYTDPRLLDVHGALDALPGLPLDIDPHAGREALRATGTEGCGSGSVALDVAQTAGPGCHSIDTPVTTYRIGDMDAIRGSVAASDSAGTKNDQVTSVVTGSSKAGEGIRTPDVQLGKMLISEHWPQPYHPISQGFTTSHIGTHHVQRVTGLDTEYP